MREIMTDKEKFDIYKEIIKPHEDSIAFRLKFELENTGIPLSMSVDEYNNPKLREQLMKDAVLKERAFCDPEDESEIFSISWVAMNKDNAIDISISSWCSSGC
jgi:hypothetical protein